MGIEPADPFGLMAGRREWSRMQWRRRRIPAHERSRRQSVLAVVGGGWDVLAWAYLFVAFVVTISRPISSQPPPVLQALQAGFPVVVAGIPVVLVIGTLSRRWIQAGAAFALGITSWFAVSPAVGRDPLPLWATGATEFRVASANLYFRNGTPLDAARALYATDADIVALSELTPSFVSSATSVGFDQRYRYRLLDPQEPVGGNSASGGLGIYSKFPFDDVVRVGRDRAPFPRMLLPDGTGIRVLPVHAESPSTVGRVGPWASDLARLGRLVEATDEPVLLVGDFNAGRWQPAFGALLRRGLTDAHEAVGRGLSRSWPDGVPLFRLDHALYTRGFAARSVRDLNIPGSDHRGFVATFAVEPPH